MKRFWLFAFFIPVFLTAWATTALAQTGETTAPTPAAPPLTVEIHGFLEADLMTDDTRSFPEVVGNAAVLQPGTLAGNNGWTQFEARNSRIDFLAKVADIDGWMTKGYLESDFFGLDPSPGNSLGTTRQLYSEAGYYTSPTFRIRHAYVDAESDGWQLLGGQTWTVFGFGPDYILSAVSLAPVMATVYERTPQIRVGKTLGDGDLKLQLIAAADRPEQRESALPDFEGGVRLTDNAWTGRFSAAAYTVRTLPAALAISGTTRTYVYPNLPSLVENSVVGQAVAADALVPLIPFDGKDGISLTAVGEYTAGSGYSDELPFWNGGLPTFVTATTATNAYNGPTAPNLDAGIAGIDPSGNFQLVQMESWNAQVQFFFPKDTGTFITLGYGEMFSPNIGNMSGGTYNDDYILFANVIKDFTDHLRVALEYDRFDTHYLSGAEPVDHRGQLSTYYFF